MKSVEKQYILGIVTDEDALFELLAKFLGKEGYEVRHVLHEVTEEENFALVIHAPARSSQLSKNVSKGLKVKQLLIGQSVDEDYLDFDNETMVLSGRPLNLKQLSETIKRMLVGTNYVGTA